MEEEYQIVTSKLGNEFKRKRKLKRYDSQVYVRLPKEELELLKTMTKQNGTSVAKICRDYLNEYVKENLK